MYLFVLLEAHIVWYPKPFTLNEILKIECCYLIRKHFHLLNVFFSSCQCFVVFITTVQFYNQVVILSKIVVHYILIGIFLIITIKRQNAPYLSECFRQDNIYDWKFVLLINEFSTPYTNDNCKQHNY